MLIQSNDWRSERNSQHHGWCLCSTYPTSFSNRWLMPPRWENALDPIGARVTEREKGKEQNLDDRFESSSLCNRGSQRLIFRASFQHIRKERVASKPFFIWLKSDFLSWKQEAVKVQQRAEKRNENTHRTRHRHNPLTCWFVAPTSYARDGLGKKRLRGE